MTESRIDYKRRSRISCVDDGRGAHDGEGVIEVILMSSDKGRLIPGPLVHRGGFEGNVVNLGGLKGLSGGIFGTTLAD